ncbi:MAG: (Fe-S)-binding protein, partial [Candidatus Marinimicrobia bacterium]|nr:(Fe-S)-binding protein [Candidatus Neomarinimicrobiota bacterium]
LLVEIDQTRENSFCCGAGGGNMWYELEQGDRINLARFDQLRASGASTIATACSFCAIMLDDAAKVRGLDEQVKIRDLAELVAESMDG